MATPGWYKYSELSSKGKYINWACQRNPLPVKQKITTTNLAYNAGMQGFIDGWDWIKNIQTSTTSCFSCGFVRETGGCFPPGVRVTLGDGSTQKAVEEIRAGDLLWNPVLKRGVKVKAVSSGPEKKDLVVVDAGGRTLRMTSEHPVLTTKGFKQARNLIVGNTLRDESGKEVVIEAITLEPASVGLSVFNFVLERNGHEHDGLLIADGLVVGDLIIQRRLAVDAPTR
jgi:hypothetical protein